MVPFWDQQVEAPEVSMIIPVSPIHHAFMIGFEDGTIRPQDNMTRAEVATILFRLIDDQYRASIWSTTNNFSDVNEGDWFNNAVSTMVNAGVIAGMPDGTFQPNRAITRGELAAIMSRFFAQYPGLANNAFDDVGGHWAQDSINMLAAAGFVTGYGDGTFAPDQLITRAEVAALINRVLMRNPNPNNQILPGMRTWPDNSPGAWYTLYLLEATNTTTYTLCEDGFFKTWLTVVPARNWTALERPNATPHSR